MSSGKATASGGAGVGPARRTWDVETYTAKARERDREDKERAVENEERVRKGEQ
jgi:U4/U6.U5 tri-snRNP component SNU23